MGLLDSIKDITGSVKDAAGDVVEFIDDKIDMPVIIDVKAIKSAGGQVYTTSCETSTLCHSTVAKATDLITFGLEMKDTLDGMTGDGGTLEASKFEVIKDLVDGDRIREATTMAGELGDLALQCVEKSQDMMEAIELGIDSLPDFIEDRIENKLDRASEKGGKEDDPDLPNVEEHCRELQSFVEEVEGVNLFTVMSSGKSAFDGLRAKGEVCEGMFTTIRDFSEDISEVSYAIQHFKLGKSIGAMKDLVRNAWRCLRLSSLIEQFAEGVGKIIKWIISLFKRASEKLGSIWGALAHAKDVLADCAKYVVECMRLCDDAKDRSGELCDLSTEIREHLKNIVTLDKSAIASIKDLSDGDEIKGAIRLATTIDDIVKDCVMQIIETIQKVCGTIKSMPAVLTEGMHGEGKDGDEGDGGATRAISFGIIDDDDDDETPPAGGIDVSGDIEELDKMRGDIEEANVFDAVGKTADGFDGIKNKIGLCGDMIVESRGFADSCNATIQSFGGVWDLESAQGHIRELFEIVSLGKLIRHFAREIKRLIHANIALMEAAKKKFDDIDFVPDQIEDLVEDVGDGLKDLGKKLKFWKK